MARKINEQLRSQRHEAICNAAVKLFATNGFSNTTITSIAKEAKISHASVFNYFPNKKDLIKHVVQDPLQNHLNMCQKILNQHVKTPDEVLLEFTEYQLRTDEFKRSFLRMIQQILGQPDQYPHLSNLVFEYAETLVNWIKKWIEKGQEQGIFLDGDPYEMAWTYYAYIHGAGLIFLGPYDGITKETIQYGMRIFGWTPRK